MFTEDVYYYLYGSQKRVWKKIGRQRKYINELILINHIDEEQWTEHFTQLYGEQMTIQKHIIRDTEIYY